MSIVQEGEGEDKIKNSAIPVVAKSDIESNTRRKSRIVIIVLPAF
jgi:hypothetical protein